MLAGTHSGASRSDCPDDCAAPLKKHGNMKIIREEISPEEIKTASVFADLDDEKAEKICDQLKELSAIIFEHITKQNQGYEMKSAA